MKKTLLIALLSVTMYMGVSASVCYVDTTLNVGICGGQTYAFNDSVFSSTGTHYDTLMSSDGCDSIIILNLTVYPVYRDTTAQSICQGLVYLGHSTSGFYSDTLTSVSGCDSILTLNLTVLPVYRDTIIQSICYGETFEGYSSGGVFSDTLNSVNGCDSITTIRLTVYPVYRDTTVKSICSGQAFGGHNTTGVYSDTLTSVNGCDSILVLNLMVTPLWASDTIASICQGQSFWGHSATGLYIDTLTSAGGCDSIRTLRLTVNPVPQTNINLNLCDGENYVFNDTLRTITGTYVAIYSANNACDSIVTLNLNILPRPIQPYITQQGGTLISDDLNGNQWFLNDTALLGDTLNTLVAMQDGNYQVMVTGPNGCSSISAAYVYYGTGVKTVADAFNVSLFPNPSNGNFVVEFSDNNSKEISLTDLLGQTVVPVRQCALKSEFNLSAFANGVYLMRIADVQNAGKVVFKQVVVQH